MFDERELKSMVVRLEKMQQEHTNGADTGSGFDKAVGLIDDLLALFKWCTHNDCVCDGVIKKKFQDGIRLYKHVLDWIGFNLFGSFYVFSVLSD